MQKTLVALYVIVCLNGAHAQSLVDYVNPFIGTGPSNVTGEAVPGGKGGATQPAAVVPFGMVQLGPDTDRPETSGYDFDDIAIRSFSMTHMSGPGCRNMGEVAFMPFLGESVWPAPDQNKFLKVNESASPGHYSVVLENGVRIDLTASVRTGMAKLSFGSADPARQVGVIFNTGIHGVGKTSGTVEFTGPRTLRGQIQGGGFCNSKGRYQVYFAVEFDRDISAQSFESNLAKMSFVDTGAPLLMKVGISLTSLENAELNLKTENPTFDFEGLRADASADWEKALSTVTVDPKAELTSKRIFYTALYHSLLHPNIGSDVDGSYMGYDQKIHQSDRPYYVNFSGWDIYRSQVQLLAFLFPDRASDIAQSLVTAGVQCGSFPKWGLNSVETNIMSGDPGSLTIANLYAFGAKNFDHETALKIMKKLVSDPTMNCQGHRTRWGMDKYLTYKYIPEPVAAGNWSSASIVLELANADFAIGNYAYALSEREFGTEMIKRSTWWRNLWDSSTKLVRPKDERGKWIEAFTPTTQKGFMEGNSAQYTWMVPHDLATLVKVMGGDLETRQRLDFFLSKSNAGQAAPHLYLGNEPAFNVPWIYLWAHDPASTQRVVRELMRSEFRDGPGGLTGNDDLGALSSWYVWSAMGMFPALPGVPGVVIGSPAFERMVITPEKRLSLIIEAPGAEKNFYVRSVKIGERSWERTWVTLFTLFSSRKLSFEMSPVPESWGSGEKNTPPSLLTGEPIELPFGRDESVN